MKAEKSIYLRRLQEPAQPGIVARYTKSFLQVNNHGNLLISIGVYLMYRSNAADPGGNPILEKGVFRNEPNQTTYFVSHHADRSTGNPDTRGFCQGTRIADHQRSRHQRRTDFE